jgi:hypothetical protein
LVAAAAAHIAATMSRTWFWCASVCVTNVVTNVVGNVSGARLRVRTIAAGSRVFIGVLGRIYPFNDGCAT